MQALATLNALPHQKQPAEGVTYSHKIEKTEAALDWTLSAVSLAPRLRPFDPFPGMTGPPHLAPGHAILTL